MTESAPSIMASVVAWLSLLVGAAGVLLAVLALRKSGRSNNLANSALNKAFEANQLSRRANDLATDANTLAKVGNDLAFHDVEWGWGPDDNGSLYFVNKSRGSTANAVRITATVRGERVIHTTDSVEPQAWITLEFPETIAWIQTQAERLDELNGLLDSAIEKGFDPFGASYQRRQQERDELRIGLITLDMDVVIRWRTETGVERRFVEGRQGFLLRF
jgi:hypothetical protein